MMLLSLYSYRSCRYCATVFLILLMVVVVVVVEEIVVKVVDDVGENIEILFKFIHNCRYINCVLCFFLFYFIFVFSFQTRRDLCFSIICEMAGKIKMEYTKKMVE